MKMTRQQRETLEQRISKFYCHTAKKSILKSKIIIRQSRLKKV